jgi:hypothetical protein
MGIYATPAACAAVLPKTISRDGKLLPKLFLYITEEI